MSMASQAFRTKERQTNEGRTVAGIVNSIETLEGGGFLVRRPFPKASFSDFDPFLLLDEMGPMDVAPGEAKGAPDHPHRGRIARTTLEPIWLWINNTLMPEDARAMFLAGNARKVFDLD